MRVEVRRARPEDAAGLTRLAHAAKRHWGYPDELVRLWAGELTVTPALIRRHPVYCAAHGSRTLGFYALSGAGATRQLEHLWVDPEFIGQGIGRRLLEHAFAFLRAEGCARLQAASDPNAEAFYREFGALPVGRIASRPEGRSLPLLEFRLA